jgi:hypothetical protein
MTAHGFLSDEQLAESIDAVSGSYTYRGRRHYR